VESKVDSKLTRLSIGGSSLIGIVHGSGTRSFHRLFLYIRSLGMEGHGTAGGVVPVTLVTSRADAAKRE